MEKKKTIIIEAQRVFRKKKHGMDFVALGLIRELQKIDTYNNYIIAVGPGEDVCLYESSNFKIKILPSTNYLIWEQLLLPKLVKDSKADILHCTSNTAPVFGKVALVLTLHDIIFMEGKMGKNASWYQKLGRIYRRFIVPRILNKVSELITVSNFEKDNIIERYPELKHKTNVVYNGVSTDFKPLVSLPTDTELEQMERGSYWLFLGNTDPKKNMANTLLGYANYLKRSEVKRRLLLLDSNDEVLNKMLEELDIVWIKPYLYIKGYISHSKLPEWYSYAFGSLYTSLRESFGLPLIEAMSCGTPVVASNTSAIPEVAGECVVYADPSAPNAIGNAMILLETDDVLRTTNIEKGLIHSKKYSWENTARETLSLYRKLIN